MNDQNAPSARLRCLRPLAWLRRSGYPVELFRPENRDGYRVVVFQKLFDREHQELAAQLRKRGTKVVLDLCDNVIYQTPDRPDLHQRAADALKMIELTDHLTVSCPAMVNLFPRRATAVIPDVVVPPPLWSQAAAAVARRLPRKRLEMVWFGNAEISKVPGKAPLAGLNDLARIGPLLEQLNRQVPLRLTVISGSREAFQRMIAPLTLPTRFFFWRSHELFCAGFPYHDLCLIPVSLNPLTMYKSNNRIALSLYLGVAVIADTIPAYEEFEGFCVLNDWETGLQRYAHSANARQQDARRGGAFVRGRYMVDQVAPQWRSFFERLLQDALPVQPLTIHSAEALGS